MYHVKNDKRCMRSAQLITDALSALLEKKPFMDITVTDIQRSAGIGRSTFYRLFDTIDDVVTYYVDMKFGEMTSDFDGKDMRGFTIACLESVIDAGEGLINILSSGRANLITDSLRSNLRQAATAAGEEAEKELQYRFAVFASACISVIGVWDENGRKESIEELADQMENYLNFKGLSQF